MKFNFRKITASAVVAVMAMSHVAFAADFDFNDESQTLNLVNVNNFTDYTYKTEYIEAASGKEAGDIAFEAQLIDAPYSFKEAPGLQIPYFDWAANTAGAIKTMELSIKYSEGADYTNICSYISAHPSAWQWNQVIEFVKFQNNKIYVRGKDTGLTSKPGEWYRIVIEEHYEAADTRVYINGQEFNPDLPGASANYILGNRWTQVLAGMLPSDKEGVRDVTVAVDDIKIYEGEYVPTEDEKVSYKIASTLSYGENAKALFVAEGTSVDTILDGIITDNEKFIIDSLESNTVVADGAVAAGNVAVIKSADGKTLEYLNIYTDQADKIVDYDSFADYSYLTMFGPTDYASRGAVTGVFAKGENDYSYDMYVKNLPGTEKSENRYNFMANANLCSAQSFTREFSIAAEGDLDEVRFILRSAYTDAEGNTIMGYQEPIRFYADGQIDANNDRTLFTVFKKNQWYRVAITVYPSECKYDLYLNNEMVVEGGDLAMEPTLQESDAYDITSIDWLQIQPFYYAKEGSEAVRNGHVYVDDTMTYYGPYYNDAANEATLSTDSYTVDEEEGIIEVEDGLDVSTFAENVDFGTAVPALYTDNTYTEAVEDRMEEGNVIVLVSENGFVYKYYTVKKAKEDVFECDEAIELLVNDVESDKIAAGTVVARINAYAPLAAPQEGKLMLAIYKGGVLQSVISDPNTTISGEVSFEVSAEIADATGVSVKAMFWNGMEAYVPVAEAK